MRGSRSEIEIAERRRTPLPATLARLFLHAMRMHDRKAALLQHDGASWLEIPDWRLERQVIRLALYLRERARLRAGDRVLIVSPLRPELIVAELAVVAQGAVSVVADPELPLAALTVAAPAPFAMLVADAALAPAGFAPVLAFDAGPAGGTSWAEALDLGGTLDTPERAQSFRAAALDVSPAAAALGAIELDGARAGCAVLSHGQAIARIDAIWSATPSRAGGVASFAGPATLTARLRLFACVGGGATTCSFGALREEPLPHDVQ